MKILNTIIITDTDSEISMVGSDDTSEFSGNKVFARDALPASLVSQLYAAVGKSLTPNKTTMPDLSGGAIKAELLGEALSDKGTIRVVQVDRHKADAAFGLTPLDGYRNDAVSE